MSETPLFVVVLTGSGDAASPPRRAPSARSTNYDVAQAFTLTLAERYQAEGEQAPDATVVRVEPDLPGVVIGEM